MAGVSGDITNTLGSIVNVADLIGGVDVTFHSGTNVAGNGTVQTVGGIKTYTFDITGNTTNGVVEFHGIGANDVDSLVYGLNGLDFATSTTGNNETWSVDVTGLKSFYVKTFAANVTVKGRAVG